ncbi:MAG: heparan-alpha-glucosaminide N-acetyltransferase domain-containing protein [Chloroflexia bacterium]
MALSTRALTHAPVSLGRLAPLDALRGLIMVAMALDHANYFVAKRHSAGEFWFQEPPTYSTDLDFLTRLVTHLAAPGFFFLMGAGMWLFTISRRRAGWREGSIRRHLALRGALLIALQLLVENRAWGLALPPGVDFSFSFYMGVLYGLGGALLFGSLLVGLPSRILVPLGIGLIALSNLFLADTASGGSLDPLRALLLTAGSSGELSVYYPILPWLGVSLLGICFARVFCLDGDSRTAPRASLPWSAPLGLALLTLFVILRLLGVGDPHAPAKGEWVAFLNVTKYPPSFDFLLLTLGANLLLLGVLAWVLMGWRLARVFLHPLLVFGQVPLFFYLLHLFLYALLGILFAPQGTTLEAMYPLWLLGLAILYPLCWGYARFKASRPAASVWRFF